MIIKSKYKDVDIPEVSLPEYLLQRIEKYGNKTALIDGPTGRSYSYAEFSRLVKCMAANLAGTGFKPGDTLAIYSPNQPEYAIAFVATVLAGGTVTTINPLYTATELTKQLQDAYASIIITTQALSLIHI